MKRRVTIALLTAVGFYVLLCAAMWALQDTLVFPGAGRGDRGVPVLVPPAAVGFVGGGDARARCATVAAAGGVAKPRAIAIYFGGNGEDLFASVYSATDLAAYGIEAIAVEHPGFGASAGRPSVASLLANALAAVALARTRAQQLGVPLVVVGTSLGSCCAVHAAAAGGVDKLVLRAPPTRLADVAQAAYPWLPVKLLLAHRFDNLASAAKVTCPTLVLHGDHDTIVPDRYGRELAAAMPNATFVSVPGYGHNDLDLSPNGPVGKAMLDFLGR